LEVSINKPTGMSEFYEAFLNFDLLKIKFLKKQL